MLTTTIDLQGEYPVTSVMIDGIQIGSIYVDCRNWKMVWVAWYDALNPNKRPKQITIGGHVNIDIRNLRRLETGYWTWNPTV